MSKVKDKKQLKKKKISNKKKNITLEGDNSKSRRNVTCLSKREVSGNWLSFMKSNGMKGKVFNVGDVVESDKVKKIKDDTEKPPTVTKVVALDCEMVSDLDNQDMLARVSLINYKLECIYDKYVKPTSKVGDYRTRFSGIREKDLEKGDDFETVRREVKTILFNKILVGHALHNDFKVLKCGHHKKLIRDTANYGPFRQGSDSRSPSLKKLAQVFLNENIQEGEHNSIEDAKTAMKLYKKFRQEWEVSLIKWKSNKQDEPQVQVELQC